MFTLSASFIFASLIFFMLLALWLGAPLVPTKPKVAERMIELLELKPGQKLFDLGSGDGRLLILANRKGVKATGIEINPYAWLLSYIQVILNGQLPQTNIILGNYWKVNLQEADAIIVYALPVVMLRLSEKLHSELKKGTRVVSNSFPIPKLKLLKEERIGRDRVYLYKIK